MKLWMRRRVTVVVALAVSLAAAVVVAGPPAPAFAVTGRVNIYAPTQMVAGAKAPVTATCPAGKVVYGGAGYVSNGSGNVILDEIVPSADLTSVSVQGLEHGGFAGAWAVTATAMCGDPTLNLQRIRIEVPRSSASPKNAVAYCPAGLKAYGLGAEILNGHGDVTLDDIEISAGLDFVNVGAYEIGTGVTRSWGLVAYAICGNPAATMVRVSATNPVAGTNGVSPKTATTAGCPAGTTITGLGAEISGGGGDVTFDQLTVGVIAAGNAVARGYENGAGSPSWKITSYGVCTS